MTGVAGNNNIIFMKFINLIIQVVLRVVSLFNVKENSIGVGYVSNRLAFFARLGVSLVFGTFGAAVHRLVVKGKQGLGTLHRHALFRCHVKRLGCTVRAACTIKIRLGGWAKFGVDVQFEVAVNRGILLLDCSRDCDNPPDRVLVEVGVNVRFL